MTRLKYMIIMYGLTALLVTGCSSGDKFYKNSFGSPIPKSVKILNSQQQYPLDCCHWLHFEIDSTDLENIIKKDFYPRHLYGPSEMTDGIVPEIENWWRPEKLGDSILYFERESEKAREGLYTNVQKTEVYFRYWWK